MIKQFIISSVTNKFKSSKILIDKNSKIKLMKLCKSFYTNHQTAAAPSIARVKGANIA